MLDIQNLNHFQYNQTFNEKYMWYNHKLQIEIDFWGAGMIYFEFHKRGDFPKLGSKILEEGDYWNFPTISQVWRLKSEKFFKISFSRQNVILTFTAQDFLNGNSTKPILKVDIHSGLRESKRHIFLPFEIPFRRGFRKNQNGNISGRKNV